MAWRFKASKYKNAAPLDPKVDSHIRDLAIGSYHSCGNFIAASAAYIAFNWDTAGSSLAVLPLSAAGRQDKAAIPRIDAHSQLVTDFAWSPFDDGLLATGSQDQTVKLWRIPETGLSRNLSEPELTLPEQPRRVETVTWHPCVSGLLTTSSGTGVSVWDLTSGSGDQVWQWQEHGDQVQSVSWSQTGAVVATQAKDKTLRLFDPRSSPAPVSQVASHDGIKDSKVVMVGDTRVLTSGFGSDRARELILRDLRNLTSPQKILSLDVSSGILVPLYDPDTNMVFLSGKGDRYIQFVEVSDKEPWFVEGLRHTGEQIKGACLVPKRALDVMQCEVNRVLQLANSSIIPITWQVPRKSYREYHADIYPATAGTTPSMGVDNWLEGTNLPPAKISLDPAKRPQQTLTQFGPALASLPRNITPAATNHRAENGVSANGSPANGVSANWSQANGVSANGRAANGVSANRSQANGVSANGRAANGHMSPKPSPRARVMRCNSEAAGETAPRPSPRPVSVSLMGPPPAIANPAPVRSHSVSSTNQKPGNVTNQKPSDETDNMLRRQPSIRDRMKMFETLGSDNDKQSTNQSPANEVSTNQSAANRDRMRMFETPSARLERKIDTEDNKENNTPASVRIEIADNNVTKDKVDNEAFLRPKARSDKNEPFVMPQMRPQTMVSNNRMSKFGRVTKFKHMKGTPLHKSMHFENLKNLSKSVPADCDFIQMNRERLVVPLAGPGGKLAVFELAKSGRIPDGVIPAVINTATVMDFALDPFKDSRLAVVTDDGGLNLWDIPSGGLVSQVNEPTVRLSAHQSEKVNIIKYNPVAEDIVATAGFDFLIKIWNLSSNNCEEVAVLQGHSDQIYSLSWSQCGTYIASVCRDGKVRIYDPRQSQTPLREDGDIVAKKGARVVWVCDGKYLVVTGFSRQSERQIMIYETRDLSCVHTETLDVSPAILIPFYDEDSSTLFLSGKGETTIYGYEIAEDAPHMFPLSPFKANTPSQGLAFIAHKNALNVREVEFARGYRLTTTGITPISFTVPRVKSTFFQDDIFPPTRQLWRPACQASDWVNGSSAQPEWVSLQPADMPSLSGNTTTTLTNNRIQQQQQLPAKANNMIFTKDTAKEVSKDLSKAVSSMLETTDRCEQDNMEGVEDKDWEE